MVTKSSSGLMGILLFARMLWGLSQSKALGADRFWEGSVSSGKGLHKYWGRFWGRFWGGQDLRGLFLLRKDSSPSQFRRSQKEEP